MKTAVIYARYSCDNQTEQSIEGQLRVCEEYAKKNDILILNTYIDRAMTGTNDNRADFQRMIKDSARKQWNYVLVYKLDRFSRDKYGTAVHKKTLKDNGVKVLSAMENIPDSPEGVILESVLEGLNQYYSMELSQKVKRGMKETRLKGNWQGGTMPYGYKEENRKVIIVEEHAEVVRYIYEQYSMGVYVKDIIKSLTAKRIYHKGDIFATNTVYGILRNDKYTGKYMLREEIIDNIYPRIISDELYNKVRARINKNKHGKRSVEVIYLLKHKIKCGYCGQSVIAESGTAKDGITRYYYKCRGRKQRVNDCQKSAIRKDVLEKLVIKAILTELKKPNTISEITNYLLKLQDDIIKANPTLNILLKEQRQIETALENIVSAIERGVITNTTTKRLKELENRQEEIEKQLVLERSKTEIKTPESVIRNFYESGLNLEPLMLINYFIREIVLYDDEVKIYFNNPLKISPNESRGFSFYNNYIKIPEFSKNGFSIGKTDIKVIMTI